MNEDELYDQIYFNIKTYLISNSIYSPLILKSTPTQTNVFPVIIVKKLESILDNETLSKTEQKFNISLEIEIYVIDKSEVSKEVISKELRKLVDYVMFHYYGFNRVIDRNIPNIDTNVDRTLLRYTCIFDTDNKIIYRR